MINFRTVTCVIMLLGILHGVDGWFCYTHEIGSDSTSYQFCPTTSCFSMGASVLGLGDSKRGCADKKYPTICQAMTFKGIVGEHVCFCNSILCNASSMPSVFMPLLLFPYLLHTLM
ncbi:uncharacterized protein [Panulirus ornatus]|uniref:uncharacterized protein n=1 Tax=Panulirus ornatus TaxID=150431 RepID=UPI003A8A493A